MRSTAMRHSDNTGPNAVGHADKTSEGLVGNRGTRDCRDPAVTGRDSRSASRDWAMAIRSYNLWADLILVSVYFSS